jgi:hypothetical protein
VPDAASSQDVAAGILANLANGPTWYATEAMAERLERMRALPRNQAVRAAAAQTAAVMNTRYVPAAE